MKEILANLLSLDASSNQKNDVSGDANKQAWLQAWERSALQLEQSSVESDEVAWKRSHEIVDDVAENINENELAGMQLDSSTLVPVSSRIMPDLYMNYASGNQASLSSIDPQKPGIKPDIHTGQTSRENNYLRFAKIENVKQSLDSRLQNLGKQYKNFNMQLTFKDENVTLWIRDFVKRDSKQQIEYVKQVKAVLVEFGYKLNRIMLNGHPLDSQVESFRRL